MSTYSNGSTKKRVDHLISLFEQLNANTSTNFEVRSKHGNDSIRDMKSLTESKGMEYDRRMRIHSIDDLDNKILKDFEDFKPEPASTSSDFETSLQKTRFRAKQIQRKYEKSLSMELDRDIHLKCRNSAHSSYDFGDVVNFEDNNPDVFDEEEDEEEDENNVELKFDEIWRNNQYEIRNEEHETINSLSQEEYQNEEDDVFSQNFIDNRYSATSSYFTSDLSDDEDQECSDNNISQETVTLSVVKERGMSVDTNTDIEEDYPLRELENESTKESATLEAEATSKTDLNNNVNNFNEKLAELEMIEKVIFENLQDLNRNSEGNVKDCGEEKKLEIIADSEGYVELRRPEASDTIYQNLVIRKSIRASQPKMYCVNMIFDDNENVRLKTISPVLPNTRPRSKKDRKEFVIDELIETEYKYIQSLEYVLKYYKPYIEQHSKTGALVGKSCYIFCNIEKISTDSKEFLHDLRKRRNDYNEVAKMFQKHKNLFDRYPVYCSNKKMSYKLITEDFKNIISKREKELDDKLGLGSYLLKPIQRLGKYEILMKNLAKYIKADGLNTRHVDSAIDIIVRATRKSNDILTLGTIIRNPYTFCQTGEFIKLENFQLINPKKMDIHLFLFKKMVIFATKDAKDIENYVYYDAIGIDSLSKTLNENEGYFTLENFHTKKKRGGGVYTFTAKDLSSKKIWLDIIDSMLWEQLKKCKRQVQHQYSAIEKPSKMSVVSVGKKVELSRNKYKSYPNSKDIGRKSKFYRNFST